MPDLPKTPKNRDLLFPVLGILLTAALLALDSATELGVADSIAYVAVVLLGLWAPQKWFIPAAGTAGTVCAILGYFLSPPGGELWKVVANRVLSIAVIWITAALCSIQKKQALANIDKERRLGAIVDNMYDALIVIDENAAVVSFNPAAERCFGYAAGEVVGENVRMLMPEPYRSEHDGYIKRYLETGQARIIGVGRELTGKRKDGSLVPMDLFLSEMFQKGRRYFIGIMRDISKRRETEDALRESEKRYHTVFDQLAMILGGTSSAIGEQFLRSLVYHLASVFNVKHAFIGELTGKDRNQVKVLAMWSNGNFAGPFEYSLKDTPCERVIAEGECHFPRDLPKLFPKDHPLVEMGLESYCGVPLRNPEGTVIGHLAIMDGKPMEGLPNRQLILPIFAARAETELERERAESQLHILSTAVEQSPSSVVIADSRGLVMYVNPNFTKTTGYTLAEVVGKNPRLWKSGIHPPEFYRNLWDTISSGKEWRGHICNKRKNGELYWEFLSILPLRDDKGGIAYFVAVKIDDTERRKAEERTRHYAAELERSNQALQDFASIASHDLQEPLRKVMVFGDRVRECVPAADRKIADYLDRMQNATLRMQRFIDDLLQYSRVATKAQPFLPTDLGEVVAGVLSDLETRIAQCRAEINVSQLPTVQADAMQMRQLFQNLIANALKFHRQDEPPVVTVVSRPGPDGFWEISVEDNGIGFDEKEADRIFKPFERLHNRSEYEGSGIGLAICRKIVERHGGTITVHSAPQKGAKFVIALPQKPRLQENLQPANVRTI